MISRLSNTSLNAFYYTLKTDAYDHSAWNDVTVSKAVQTVPGTLAEQPIFLSIDDTMIEKSGNHFELCSKLYDHAAHNGSNYLNGHCFVSLMLCVPVWRKQRVVYLAVPLGYRMWNKEVSKLGLAASMIRQVMPVFLSQRNAIVLCDSWYAKKDLVRVVDEYANLDIICNARYDSVIYDPAPQPTGRKGRPAKHGKRLSPDSDFTLSDEKIGEYHIGERRVLTNLFGQREVLAYVTASGKTQGSRRLFFSTIFPHQMQMFCAWQEKAPLNQTGSSRMKFIPMLCYCFRRNIEVSYYEQKTFWSLCSYMVRSQKGIEMLVNLINIAYCAMKILPYQEKTLSKYQGESVQELRFALSVQIRQQIFYASLLQNIEAGIKSCIVIKVLQRLLKQQNGCFNKL